MRSVAVSPSSGRMASNQLRSSLFFTERRGTSLQCLSRRRSTLATLTRTNSISSRSAPVVLAARAMRSSSGLVMVCMNSNSWPDRYLKVWASMDLSTPASFTLSLAKCSRSCTLRLKPEEKQSTSTPVWPSQLMSWLCWVGMSSSSVRLGNMASTRVRMCSMGTNSGCQCTASRASCRTWTLGGVVTCSTCHGSRSVETTALNRAASASVISSAATAGKAHPWGPFFSFLISFMEYPSGLVFQSYLA